MSRIERDRGLQQKKYTPVENFLCGVFTALFIGFILFLVFS